MNTKYFSARLIWVCTCILLLPIPNCSAQSYDYIPKGEQDEALDYFSDSLGDAFDRLGEYFGQPTAAPPPEAPCDPAYEFCPITGNPQAVRLSGFNGENNVGKVEIQFNDTWWVIQGGELTRNEASIICKTLGFDSTSFQIDAFGSYAVPPEDYTAQQFLNLKCKGTESSIQECGLETEESYSVPVAGLACAAPNTSLNDTTAVTPGDRVEPVTYATIRLVDATGAPTSGPTGRLEVLHNGIWGAVSSCGVDLTAATVACRQLGWPGASQVLTLNPQSSNNLGNPLVVLPAGAQFWLRIEKCSGEEAYLQRCCQGTWGQSYGYVDSFVGDSGFCGLELGSEGDGCDATGAVIECETVGCSILREFGAAGATLDQPCSTIISNYIASTTPIALQVTSGTAIYGASCTKDSDCADGFSCTGRLNGTGTCDCIAGQWNMLLETCISSVGEFCLCETPAEYNFEGFNPDQEESSGSDSASNDYSTGGGDGDTGAGQAVVCNLQCDAFLKCNSTSQVCQLPAVPAGIGLDPGEISGPPFSLGEAVTVTSVDGMSDKTFETECNPDIVPFGTGEYVHLCLNFEVTAEPTGRRRDLFQLSDFPPPLKRSLKSEIAGRGRLLLQGGGSCLYFERVPKEGVSPPVIPIQSACDGIRNSPAYGNMQKLLIGTGRILCFKPGSKQLQTCQSTNCPTFRITAQTARLAQAQCKSNPAICDSWKSMSPFFKAVLEGQLPPGLIPDFGQGLDDWFTITSSCPDFAKCCAGLKTCYQTCGKVVEECFNEYGGCLNDVCANPVSYQDGSPWFPDQVRRPLDEQSCKSLAALYYNTLTGPRGWQEYAVEQDKYCECPKKPPPPPKKKTECPEKVCIPASGTFQSGNPANQNGVMGREHCFKPNCSTQPKSKGNKGKGGGKKKKTGNSTPSTGKKLLQSAGDGTASSVEDLPWIDPSGSIPQSDGSVVWQFKVPLNAMCLNPIEQSSKDGVQYYLGPELQVPEMQSLFSTAQQQDICDAPGSSGSIQDLVWKYSLGGNIAQEDLDQLTSNGDSCTDVYYDEYTSDDGSGGGDENIDPNDLADLISGGDATPNAPSSSSGARTGRVACKILQYWIVLMCFAVVVLA